jgi:hypothetical protein
VKCGAAVARSNPAQPEIVGDVGVLVDASNPAAIAQALNSLLVDRKRRDAVLHKATFHGAGFTWDKVADAILDTLDRDLPQAIATARTEVPDVPAPRFDRSYCRLARHTSLELGR